MSDALDSIEAEKRRLLLSLVDNTDSESECVFWKKLIMIQGNTYTPEYEEEIEDNTNIEDNGNIEGNFSPEKKYDSYDESCQNERSLEDIHITSFVTDIIALAEDEIDSEFWRAYETKLYGKWLKDDEVFPAWTESLDSINWCNTDITRDHIRNSHNERLSEDIKTTSFVADIIALAEDEIDSEFWRAYEKKLYGKWLKDDEVFPVWTESLDSVNLCNTYITRDPIRNNQLDVRCVSFEQDETRMAKALKKQFECAQKEAYVSYDKLFENRDKLIRKHNKKMQKKSTKTRISRFFTRVFSCFRRQKHVDA